MGTCHVYTGSPVSLTTTIAYLDRFPVFFLTTSVLKSSSTRLNGIATKLNESFGLLTGCRRNCGRRTPCFPSQNGIWGVVQRFPVQYKH